MFKGIRIWYKLTLWQKRITLVEQGHMIIKHVFLICMLFLFSLEVVKDSRCCSFLCIVP